METMTITMPNGMTIEWKSDTTEGVQPKLALPSQEAKLTQEPKAEPKPATAAKPSRAPKPTVAKATVSRPKAEKAEKVDAKQLLADIRAEYRKGNFATAISMTPKTWVQVVKEVALAQERSGDRVTLNPATVGAKPPKTSRKARPKAEKVATVAKATELAGAIEAPAKRVTQDSQEQQAAKTAQNVAADTVMDCGAARSVVELVRSCTVAEFAADLRTRIAQEDPTELWVELTELSDEIGKAWDATQDRDLSELLDAWLLCLDAASQRVEAKASV